MSQNLFDGVVENCKLSNLGELIEVIPEQFVQGNAWHAYVEYMFVCGVAVINHSWRYKNNYHLALIDHMKVSFISVFSDETLDAEKKISLCAWMLSEMLEEVPEYGLSQVQV